VQGSTVGKVAVAATAIALGVGGFVAADAGAKSETLHFYSKQVTNVFTDAAGHTIHLNPPKTVPAKGDHLSTTDLDYAGTAAHHASQWTASDQLTCTLTSSATGLCNAEIAIGGSMLVADGVTLNLAAPRLVVPLSGGTGVFRGARGSITVVGIGNSSYSNVTVEVS
jgi:hypothetical protein